MLSYPRSGSHFVRYIVEYLTGRSTAGGGPKGKLVLKPSQGLCDTPICLRKGIKFLGHVEVENPVAFKQHFSGKSAIPSYMDVEDSEGLILIVRHPAECMISHFKGRRDLGGNFLSSINFAKQKLGQNKYLGNLEFYMNYEKPKICIFYEDLISDTPDATIKSIANFFGASPMKCETFLNNIEKYRDDSVKSPLRPCSNQDSSNFYRSKLTSAQRKDVTTALKKSLEHPLIAQRYSEIEEKIT